MIPGEENARSERGNDILMQRLKEKLQTKRGKIYPVFWGIYWIATMSYLLMHYNVVLAAEEDDTFPYIIIFRILAAVVVVTAGICFWIWVRRPVRAGNEKVQKGRMKPWHFLVLLANACYAFCVMEFINNPILKDMKIRYMLLNVAGIMIITIIWLLWLNSFRRTLIINLVFFTVMSLVFYTVYLFRGEPFQFIDIFSIGTAMEVAGQYTFVTTRAIVVFVVISLCLLGLYIHLPDYNLVRKLPARILTRVGVFGGMIAGYFLYLNTSWNGDLGILTDLWAPLKTYQEYGTTVGFCCVAKYMRLTPPDGYTLEGTKEVAEKFRDSQEESGAPDTGSGSVTPVNIIAIMSESWADYRMVGDLKTTEEVMPFYDSMEENTIKGNTLVCIRGGGTAKTEYEFLTGNSVKRFPAMVPYVSYYTHDQYSLFSTLEDQGYEIAAMHPNKGTNWNRTTAYRLMGVENFYTIDDFPADAQKLRGHITDQANFEAIIDLVENKESADEPFFLFDVTMQNHGGYTTNNYNGDVQVEGYTDDTVNRYLSLLKESDDALEYLISYFENCDQPTLIVMFGDHYPDLPDEFTEYISGQSYDDCTLEQQEMYYATPFFIWANYDIEEASGVMTSTNYLGTMMLEQTNLQLPWYNQYLENLQQEIPALNHLGYMDADQTWHSWSEAEDEEDHLEWEYECLQYNNLTQKRNRLNWFFSLTDS